ncbi:CCR4-NOT transcription complex subunit 9-like [Homarus americanus]|uniref:CCR4-NOT transcription complex subunit 9 n=1 Tax=Homarus americanus TaxID=6706 RepID=A0A8J5K428_HOMAM|nr:CCR4-NOT transcription complex subunit 9-like [Homarus americanus]
MNPLGNAQGTAPGQRFLGAGSGITSAERDKIYQWIIELANPDTRENALLELRFQIGRVFVLIGCHETYRAGNTDQALVFVEILQMTMPPTKGKRKRVVLSINDKLKILNQLKEGRSIASLATEYNVGVTTVKDLRHNQDKCVASHPETRSQFLAAHIPLYLYPFLQTVSKTRPFEYLRLTSLGVIGALVKTDEQEVINFLLTTEIIPLCLRIMESGSELSKTVATFILQKILLDETGLNYICQASFRGKGISCMSTYERFSHVAMILGKMVIALAKEQSARAREALRQCLPDQLKDQTFAACLKDDKSTKHWLQQLLANLESTAAADPRIALPPLAAQ